ncbi:hypothetical protein ACUZ9N_01415 [Mycoplasmopsis gallinarum]
MKIFDELNEFSTKIEFKKLSELGTFYSGLKNKKSSDFENGNSKYITYLNVFNNPEINLNVNDFVKINSNENQNSIKYGDVLFTTSSENQNEVGMSSVVTKEPQEKIYLNSFCRGF